MDLDKLRVAVWELSGADARMSGGCWCQRFTPPDHEPECQRVRDLFAADPMPYPPGPPAFQIGQVGAATEPRP